MATATVRIPEEKRDILKVIASLEKREMKDIITELIDEYIARHKETLDILSRPEWVGEKIKGLFVPPYIFVYQFRNNFLHFSFLKACNDF